MLPTDRADVLELSRQWRIPGLRTLDGLFSFYFKTYFLRDYTGPVIFSGSSAVVAVHNHTKGKNILYCHTIPRFAYDMRDYIRDTVPTWQRPLFDLLVLLFRITYRSALGKMDIILVNSENVQKRLKTYLDYDSLVVHPPVETSRFKHIEDGEYYLSTARLESYKRVSLIIDAFKQMPDRKLIVTSSGSQENALRKQAQSANNIQFTGWVSEDKLRDIVGRSLATLYMPMDEDFGISPVESMAAGKPVIGANEGGIIETVIHKKTGYLCAPTVSDIVEAVRWLDAKRALIMHKDCVSRAEMFDKTLFVEKIGDFLK